MVGPSISVRHSKRFSTWAAHRGEVRAKALTSVLVLHDLDHAFLLKLFELCERCPNFSHRIVAYDAAAQQVGHTRTIARIVELCLLHCPLFLLGSVQDLAIGAPVTVPNGWSTSVAKSESSSAARAIFASTSVESWRSGSGREGAAALILGNAIQELLALLVELPRELIQAFDLPCKVAQERKEANSSQEERR